MLPAQFLNSSGFNNLDAYKIECVCEIIPPMVLSEASEVIVASLCTLYGCTTGLTHNSCFIFSKADSCCMLPHEKLLFLMSFKGNIFVAKSGIIFL